MCSGNDAGSVAMRETVQCDTVPVGLTIPSMKFTADLCRCMVMM
jgi:hypothetical protein